MMQLDPKHCYEVIKAQDARFDGLFYVGVSTTGIYCRPVCTVRTPGRDRCTFYSNAASAEAAGFRPCLRCRPELAPGAAPMDAVRRVADLAVARIDAGALSNSNMAELALEFGISSRQLRRVVAREYGVTPVELAQTRRLLLAKQLLTDTRLKLADIAFASGFSSVRRFNHLFRSRYGLNPGALRRQHKRQADDDNNAGDGVTLKLGYRPPLAWLALAGFLASRSTSCVEQFDGMHYLRTVRIGQHSGWISATPDARKNQLHITVAPSLVPVLVRLRACLRQLFDLDANPAVIEAHLAADPRMSELISMTPGLRIPGTLDGFELALRAVLGQQISVKAASTLFGRFARHFGEEIQTPHADLNRLSPNAADIADASLQSIIDQGVTRRRAETLKILARAVADNRLSLSATADGDTTMAGLREIPGIGPWTRKYIYMRALAHPDAFPDSDLGLRKAIGLQRPAELKAVAEQWRPWRAYAAMHLWQDLSAGG